MVVLRDESVSSTLNDMVTKKPSGGSPPPISLVSSWKFRHPEDETKANMFIAFEVAAQSVNVSFFLV